MELNGSNSTKNDKLLSEKKLLNKLNTVYWIQGENISSFEERAIKMNKIKTQGNNS